MNRQKILTLLLFVLISAGANLFGQKITKNFNKTPLKAVLKEVEAQIGLSIIYQPAEVNDEKMITATFSEASLDQVLKQVLDDNLTFSVENKMLVIYRKGTQAPNLREGTKKTGRKDISGVIKDASGEPLIGVTVRVRGVGGGATTDIDGQFSLPNVPEDAVLEVSYIGMQAQTIPTVGKATFNIVMQDDSKQLEEVVVTAMGIERKAKSLTYATQKMDNEELMRVQDANFINSLQGKAAGLSITPNAGGAGGSSKILLRGNKSVSGNNQPLIVLDGIPMSNTVKGASGTSGYQLEYSGSGEGTDALSSINPDDIESINILKGANAAALYGSAASNGVLMITTKKGKEGSLVVGLTSNATFEQPLLLPRFQRTYGGDVNELAQTVELNSWGKRIVDMTATEIAIRNMTNKAQDYAADFFNTGMTLNNSVSLSGGTKALRTYFSYGNTHSKGMIENNAFNRHTISFRQSYNLFNDYLKIDVSINYLNQTTKNRPGGGIAYNPLYNLYISPRNIDLNHYKTNYKINGGEWQSNPYAYYKIDKGRYTPVTGVATLVGPKQNWVFESAKQNNPYWLTRMNRSQADEERVYGYLSGNLKLLDGLTAQGRLSLDRAKTASFSEKYATTQSMAAMIDYGEYSHYRTNRNEIYLDWMLNYNKEFGNYALSASGGWTAHQTTDNTIGFYIGRATVEQSDIQTKLPTEVNVFEPIAGRSGGRSYSKGIDWDEGVFFTGQLGYKDYLFVEGSYRHDWYRAFKQFNIARGTPLSYGYYSAGVNALIHEMIALPKFWNYFKARVSYSEVGNSIPNQAYDRTDRRATTGAVQPSKLGYYENPIPEKTKSLEAGFDASFFKNALNWDVTLYNSTMHNNYLTVSVAGKSKPVNSGVIRNRGIETTLSYAMNLTNDLLWKTGVNFAYNHNKILETYVDPDGRAVYISEPIGTQALVQVKYIKGGSYGDLYVADFARDTDGKIKLDASGRPLRTKNVDTYAGNLNAPYQLGWYNNLNYKNLSLYFLIDGRIGGKVLSFTEAYMDYYGTSERTGKARDIAAAQGISFNGEPGMVLPDGQITSIRQYYETVGGENPIPGNYIYDATNFRMREVSLGYTFRNVLGIARSLSLSLVGRNLFFLYNKAPVDPDTSLSTRNSLGNVDIFNMPTSRSVGLSLNVTF